MIGTSRASLSDGLKDCARAVVTDFFCVVVVVMLLLPPDTLLRVWCYRVERLDVEPVKVCRIFPPLVIFVSEVVVVVVPDHFKVEIEEDKGDDGDEDKG